MDAHVAVLVLDTPIPGVVDQFGDFGDNVVTLIGHSKYPVVKYYVASDENTEEDVARTTAVLEDVAAKIARKIVKGVVLTGSRSDSFAQGVPWIDLLDKFIQTTLFATPGLPIVGLCFGHQILAKNLGCKVCRSATEIGWEAGTTTIALNKSILDIADSPFRTPLVVDDGKILDHINLVEFHRDTVYGMPPTSKNPLLLTTTFQNVGSTPKCSIQGFITESGPIKLLTFQGHPEFSTPQSLMMLDKMLERKAMDKAVYDRLAYNTKNLVNQGGIIGKVIEEFIESQN